MSDSAMSIRLVIDTILQLNELHNALLEIGREKTKVIIYNQVAELAGMTNKETRLAKQIGQAQSQLQAAMTKFVQQSGFTLVSSLNVSEIAKLVFNAEDKKALLGAQARLASTIQELTELNNLNIQLVQQSLAYIDYSIDLMTGSPYQDAIYGKPSDSMQPQPTKRSGRFDARG